MCNAFLKELKGWLKSFTRTEILLSLIEAVLLVIFVGFLIFLILHFVVCSDIEHEMVKGNIPVTIDLTHLDNVITNIENEMVKGNVPVTTVFSQVDDVITTEFSGKVTEKTTLKPTIKHTKPKTPATVKPGIKCTWKLSQKTKAYIHYFYPVTKLQNISTNGFISFEYQTMTNVINDRETAPTAEQKIITENEIYTSTVSLNEESDVLSDGEDATEANKRHILALVKLRSPKDIIVRCIVTVFHESWVLTAASCLEAIKEVDSLDNFVMMEGYGSGYSKYHAVADVQIHPLYNGSNISYDLAALKSENSLVEGVLRIVNLPDLLDYFMLTIAERLTVLGYGSFRSVDNSRSGTYLRQAYLHNLPARQCSVSTDTWSLHTLKSSGRIVHALHGTAPLCAGVLFSRGTPCNYCAGTPLMYGSVLYGIMSYNQQCGVTCEPQIYVNIAVAKEWLDSIKDNK